MQRVPLHGGVPPQVIVVLASAAEGASASSLVGRLAVRQSELDLSPEGAAAALKSSIKRCGRPNNK